MSKKFNSKGFIPSAMSGKKFSDLCDLGAALGFKPSEQSAPKPMKCRKCGTIMRNIPGTNVWVCDGVVEQEKDGEMAACGNRALTSVRPVSQSSENPGNPKSKQKHQGKPSGKPAQFATA